MTFKGIQRPYKLRVSIGQIAGSVPFEKYGRIPIVSTTTDPEDIWFGGDLYTGFPPIIDAGQMELFSSNPNDTMGGTGAHAVRVMNLLDITGAQIDDIVAPLGGLTKMAVGGAQIGRTSRMKVETAGALGENQGEITLRHVANPDNVFAVMPALANSTTIGAFTVPLGKTLHIDFIGFWMTVMGGADGSSLCSLRARPVGGVFDSVVAPIVTSLVPYQTRRDSGVYKFAELTDIKCRVDSVTNNNTSVYTEMRGDLIDNDTVNQR